jgi:ParB family transcriptional regulator, chromosome partitioning protein
MQHVGGKILILAPGSVDTSSQALFWAEEPDDRFLHAMKNHGQAQPVHVAPEGGRCVLLSGFKRVRAAVRLELELLAVEVEAPAPFDRGVLYLLSNLGRGMTEAMQVSALRYFSSCAEPPAIRDQVLPLLEIVPGSRHERELLEWLALPEPWDTALESRAAPLAAAGVLRLLDPGDLAAVEPFYHGLRWSRQNGVQWLTWLFERSRMDGIPVRELIERAGMRAILERLDQGLSPKDAIDRLSRAAYSLRYPELAGMRGRFDSLARELTRGTPWRMSHNDNFETAEIELSSRCRSPLEVERAARSLMAMHGRGEWDGLWSLLGIAKQG